MTWSNLMFQDSMSPIMHHMIFFHEYIMMMLIFIISIIMYLSIMMLKNLFYSNKIIDHQLLEFIWTLFPMLILIFFAFPSIKILYLTEELKSPHLTLKSIGNQWYWSYEYPQFNNINFDSFMLKSMTNNSFRLLDVDNHLIAPTQTKIRMLSTSNDVIHSFTIPSLGFKIDSIPGRMNQTSFYSNIPSVLYGQCSEICGMNHSFMPIVMETMNNLTFFKWIKNF